MNQQGIPDRPFAQNFKYCALSILSRSLKLIIVTV